MTFRSTPRRTLIALLGAAGLIAGSGVASAEMTLKALPGTADTAVQFAVGTKLATVTVNPAGADATEITGTFTNNSDTWLDCEAPGLGLDLGAGGGAATVTEAALVDRSLAYLRNNTVFPSLGAPIDVDLGSADVILASGSLGSLGLGDPAAVELDEIQRAQDRERLDGHYGTVGEFYVAPEGGEFSNNVVEWSAPLTVPSGERTDFDAAALFTCMNEPPSYEEEDSSYERPAQWYAFAGYEETDDDDDNDDGGSLSMGSLGS